MGRADSNVVAKVFTSSGKVISALNAVVITVPLVFCNLKIALPFTQSARLAPRSHCAIGMGTLPKSFCISPAFWPADASSAVIRPPRSSDMDYENDKVVIRPLHSVTFNMYWSLWKRQVSLLVTACTGQDAIEVETWSEDRLRAAVLAPLEATFGTSTVSSVNLLGMLHLHGLQTGIRRVHTVFQNTIPAGRAVSMRKQGKCC